ncbi:hypothetical protein PAMP_002597 [Pampus punctatissimus]
MASEEFRELSVVTEDLLLSARLRGTSSIFIQTQTAFPSSIFNPRERRGGGLRFLNLSDLS